MKLEHDGTWKLTEDNGEISRPLANTIASKFNRLVGDNTRLRRETANLEEEVTELKRRLGDDSSSNGSRFKMDLTSFVIVFLAAVIGALAGTFNEEITNVVSGFMSTELTVGRLIVVGVIAFIFVTVLVQLTNRMKTNGDGQLTSRLKAYGRNNQESSDSDQTTPTNPSLLHQLGIKRNHRGGES